VARSPSRLLAVGLALALAGCATFEGARLYDEGSAALDRGDTALAIRQLEEAAALVPDASEVQNHLGIAYLQDGREADALHAFERAVALDCSNAPAQANLRALRARKAAR
jgi:Flp pilus assembly protein TadD